MLHCVHMCDAVYSPALNKGAAFTREERETFELEGCKSLVKLVVLSLTLCLGLPYEQSVL